MFLIGIIVLIIVSTVVVWKASDALGDAADHLAYHHNMPSIVKGAIIAAVASSFPEFATVILSTAIHNAFELGVAAIVGSALFNILIIPAACQIAIKKPLDAHRDIVFKEGQFYLISVVVLLLIFTLSALYFPVLGTEYLRGELNRGLVLVPLLLYVLYLFIQHQEIKDGRHEIDTFEPEMSLAKSWGKLILSMILIFIACEGLVYGAIEIGEILHMPVVFWGLTVVAAGTSVPDTLISVRDAKQGEAGAALGNAFGSNVFDLLICIPTGVLIAGTAVIAMNEVIPLMGFLTFATLLTFIFLRIGLKLKRRESITMLGVYAVFVLWMLAESLGFSHLVW